MRLLLSAALLLVASSAATAQEEDRLARNKRLRALMAEVDAARKLVDPMAKDTPATTTGAIWDAVAAGADVMLVPASQAAEARDAAAGRVDVVGVATLSDAIEALRG